MASKSKVTAWEGDHRRPTPPLGPVARATSMPRSSTEATACTARQAVAWEATGPNSASWSRSTASLDRQSAPSAMATARWVSTMPGS